MTVAPTATAIFGAGGFIGRHLQAALQAAGQPVVGITRKGGIGLLSCDFAAPDLAPLRLRERGVTRAVLAAAVTGIASCEREPLATRAINVEGTVAVARQLVSAGIRVIALSSDYVFDGNSGEYAEDAAVNPLNEYGRQKAEMERQLLAECGADLLILRLSKVFDLVPGSGTLLDEMVHKLRGGVPLMAASDQFFCPTWVRDVVVLLTQLLDRNVSGLLHLCAPTRITRYHLARQVAAAFQVDASLVREISLRDLGEPFPRPLDTSMRCQRLAALFPYRFRGIADCLGELITTYEAADHGQAY